MIIDIQHAILNIDTKLEYVVYIDMTPYLRYELYRRLNTGHITPNTMDQVLLEYENYEV